LKFLLSLALSFLILTPQSPSQPIPTSPSTPLPPPTVHIDDYRESTARIIGAALTSDKAYQRLAYLTDRIGNRLSGSKGLERAIEWAVSEMKRDGLNNVRAEKVMVPHWVRGTESLEITSPLTLRLAMLGLGNSMGTATDGITAEAVVVRSFDELDKLGEAVRGKIVVYNAAFTNYGATVAYRVSGASRAARYGAVAVLVRSVTPTSLQSPHTGAMRYDETLPKIPAAAITIETAELLQRMNDRGEHPALRLKMGAKFLADAESANVVGELKGTDKADEILLVSGHLDSWDVGQGAHDDGGGCIVAWHALTLLKELGLKPRRTIRVVLYTNEENGGRGGVAYLDEHRAELARHVLAIESDLGTYRPVGFGLSANAPTQARANLQEIAKLLTSIRADHIAADGGGSDIGPLMAEGVVTGSFDVDSTRYFEIHHSEADTLDKISAQDVASCVAAMAVMIYTVADMPQSLK